VLALYAKAPANGVVVSFDQMGPISLRPTAGSGWAPASDPSGCGPPFTRHATYRNGPHRDQRLIDLERRRHRSLKP
jgi:hypothetical protein